MRKKRGAASHFSVNEKQVRQWRLKKEELNLMPKKKKRLDGGGRKARLPDVEETLMAWMARQQFPELVSVPSRSEQPVTTRFDSLLFCQLWQMEENSSLMLCSKVFVLSQSCPKSPGLWWLTAEMDG